METRARYALVGSVVIAVVSLGALFVLWLSNGKDEAELDSYSIYFRKFSLSGLQVNSWVTMRGIKVGTVDTLHVSAKDIELIKVVVKLTNTTPVKTDTRAVIERNLLTGLASIDLIGSSQDAQRLAKSEGEDYPVIPEGETGLGAIQDNLPQLFERTSLAINRLNSILSPENEKSVAETLKNLREISEVLAKHKGDISQTFAHLNEFTSHAKELMESLETNTTNLTQSLTKTSEVVSLEVTRAGRSITSAADSVSATLENYEDPGAIIRGRSESALGPGEKKR